VEDAAAAETGTGAGTAVLGLELTSPTFGIGLSIAPAGGPDAGVLWFGPFIGLGRMMPSPLLGRWLRAAAPALLGVKLGP